MVVFFTRGMSLAAWDRSGLLSRELRVYGELAPELGDVAFVTYAGGVDLSVANRLPGVIVLPNRWRLPSNLYSILAPWLHRRVLRGASIFKTNQINGAWCGVIAKRLFRKPLVVRCGYLWSDFVARRGAHPLRRHLVAHVERMVFRAADRVMVPTEADKRTIVTRYGTPESHVHVVPNYVDTAKFCPALHVTRTQRLVSFVGRLDPQKNPLALIDAVRDIPNTGLIMIGDGPLRDSLRRHAAGMPVEFLTRVHHDQLPEAFNRSDVFVMPSLYEGHPKALLEAMACGVPVIGTRVPGIENLLVHRETGFLCGTSASEIREALLIVLSDAGLCVRMAQQARKYVETECSLHTAVKRELAVLQSI